VNSPADNRKPVAVETVLVLDSDVLVRMPIARYLRDCGYRVLEAANVDEAMTVLLKDDIQVDVVLSDVEMPGSMKRAGRNRNARRTRLFSFIRQRSRTAGVEPQGLNYLRTVGLAESDEEVSIYETEMVRPRPRLPALYPF
jgi:CheY-like chemotaxis protein